VETVWREPPDLARDAAQESTSGGVHVLDPLLLDEHDPLLHRGQDALPHLPVLPDLPDAAVEIRGQPIDRLGQQGQLRRAIGGNPGLESAARHLRHRLAHTPQGTGQPARDEIDASDTEGRREQRPENDDQAHARERLRDHVEGQGHAHDPAVPGRERHESKPLLSHLTDPRVHPGLSGEGLRHLPQPLLASDACGILLRVGQHAPVGVDHGDPGVERPPERADLPLEPGVLVRQRAGDGRGLGHQRIRQVVEQGRLDPPIENDPEDGQDHHHDQGKPHDQAARQRRSLHGRQSTVRGQPTVTRSSRRARTRRSISSRIGRTSWTLLPEGSSRSQSS
jgi:hypothetical protein